MKGDDEQGIGSRDTLDGRFILHSTVLNRAVPPVYIRRASKPSRAYQTHAHIDHTCLAFTLSLNHRLDNVHG